MKKRIATLFLVSSFMLFFSGCSDFSKEKWKSTGNSEQNVKKDPIITSKTINEPVHSKPYSVHENQKVLNARVIKNVDGDTVIINLNGKNEKVRLLCIDTPETHHPRLGVQPFGPEAAAFTKSELYIGRTIQVELGIGNGRDKYGRLLAYIFINGRMLNETLLEKGLARVAYIYPPNTIYVDEFYTLQKKAQQKGIGIWSLENYAKADGFHSLSTGTPPNNSTRTDTDKTSQNNSVIITSDLTCKGKIKGNKNSHIYHVPGGSFYKISVKNIVWFCTEQEAKKAGYHKAKR